MSLPSRKRANPLSETFSYSKAIFLKDLTIYGNTYFSRFFDWQGEAREALLLKIMSSPSDLFNKRLKLVTLAASVKYMGEVNYGDTIIIDVIPSKITLTTIELDFIYRKEKEGTDIAEGHQRIGFTNRDGRILPLPKILLANGKKYLSKDALDHVAVLERKLLWISEHSSLR